MAVSKGSGQWLPALTHHLGGSLSSCLLRLRFFKFLIFFFPPGSSGCLLLLGKPWVAVAQKNVMFWEWLPKSLGNRDFIFWCSSYQMKETFCKAICCCANWVLNAAGNGKGGEKPGKWVILLHLGFLRGSLRELLERLGLSIGSFWVREWNGNCWFSPEVSPCRVP